MQKKSLNTNQRTLKKERSNSHRSAKSVKAFVKELAGRKMLPGNTHCVLKHK